MFVFILGIILTAVFIAAMVKKYRTDPQQDYTDKLAELVVDEESLKYRDEIADKQSQLNKKRSKVVKKETKLER